MSTIDYNGKIQFFGVVFHGANDIIYHATRGIPKDGVYVGNSSESYLCFDSSDYAYEKRHYWNLVFARSKEELDKKMQILANKKSNGNYNKFTYDLAPMIYWEGDNYYPMRVTECEEVAIPEKKQPKLKITQKRPAKTKMELIMKRLKQEL